MSGLATIVGRSSSKIDGDHISYPIPAVGAFLSPRSTNRPVGAQFVKQLAVESFSRRNVEASVDRLVRDPHRRIVRVLAPEPDGDLLRRALLVEFRGDGFPQNWPHRQRRHFGSAGADISGGIGLDRPVVLAPAVAGDLACNRGRGSSEFFGDFPSTVAGGDSSRNFFSFACGDVAASSCSWDRSDTAGLT